MVDIADYPQVYSSAGERLAVLDKSYDVIVNDQIITDTNGQSTLTLSLPLDDPKQELFDAEDEIHVTGSVFIIRTIQPGWDSQGTLATQIYAEAKWYDLSGYDPVQPVCLTGATAEQVLSYFLETTDWAIGEVDIDGTMDFTLSDVTNPLSAIMSLPSLYGGELNFDSLNQKVSLLQKIGADNGLLYSIGRDLQSNQRTIDTRNLYTRIRPYGANDENGNPITIASVNDGLDYVDNYQWYDGTGKPRKMHCYEATNDQLTDPAAIKAWGESVLAGLSMPKITYLSQIVIDKKKGIPNIGDTVRVRDTKLNVVIANRIAQRNYNALQPWLSTVQLSSALYTSADQTTSQTQAISTQISNVSQTSSQSTALLSQLTTPDGKLDLSQSEGRLSDSQCSVGPGTAFSPGYDPSQSQDIPLASPTQDGLESKINYQILVSIPFMMDAESNTYKAIVSDTVWGGLMSAEDVKKVHSLPKNEDGSVAEATESDDGLLGFNDKMSLNMLTQWFGDGSSGQIFNPKVTDPHTESDANLSDVLANFEQRLTTLGG